MFALSLVFLVAHSFQGWCIFLEKFLEEIPNERMERVLI